MDESMALTGLEIFKLLPRKNCKECGHPTCLAFATALAASKTTLDKCPHVSEEAKETLGGAAAPPIKTIMVGKGSKERKLGDEVVLFRHDKAFYSPTCLAVTISDNLSGAELDAKIEKVNGLVFERVGQKTSIDLVAVVHESKDAAKYTQVVKTVAEKSNFALLLVSECTDAMEAALEVAKDGLPLVYAATETNYEKMAALAAKAGCPLVVKGNGLESTADLVAKVTPIHKDLVIDTGSRQLSQSLADLTQIRRLAIKKKFRPFGYPVIAFAQGDTPEEEVVQASVFVAKYAGIVVLNADGKAQILPLTAERMNIYSDPQKPSQVEPKVNKVGEPTDESPVYCTTNFSLTYYTVEGEISASKIPSYIISCPTDGTSVLTAWAAGKFTGEKIAEFIGECGIENIVKHRNIVIPGHVAVIKGVLEEKSGWKVMIAPAEASGLPAYAKANFS